LDPHALMIFRFFAVCDGSSWLMTGTLVGAPDCGVVVLIPVYGLVSLQFSVFDMMCAIGGDFTGFFVCIGMQSLWP
jgi:hypothetical protein